MIGRGRVRLDGPGRRGPAGESGLAAAPTAVGSQEGFQHVRDQRGGIDLAILAAVFGGVEVEFFLQRFRHRDRHSHDAEPGQRAELEVGHQCAP